MSVLLLSDVQGNLTALDAVLSTEAARRADTILCLGDLASGPLPGETIERLRRLGASSVRGNMDDVIAAPRALTDQPENARRFAEIDRWGSAQLDGRQRSWLASLPLTVRCALGGDRSLLAFHGSPHSNEDVIEATTPAASVRGLLAGVEAEIVAVGHMHEPMLRRLDDLLLVHPGSVGWPRPLEHGLRPLRAEFAVLESTTEDLRVEFHQVRYSFESLRRSVLESGMPNGSWYLEHWHGV